MNTFTSAIQNQGARTENGMKARKSTAKATTDLFFKIGASRGKNIIPDFIAAFAEDKDLAVRIAQWARDVRGGAGERKLFRDILSNVKPSFVIVGNEYTVTSRSHLYVPPFFTEI